MKRYKNKISYRIFISFLYPIRNANVVIAAFWLFGSLVSISINYQFVFYSFLNTGNKIQPFSNILIVIPIVKIKKIQKLRKIHKLN